MTPYRALISRTVQQANATPAVVISVLEVVPSRLMTAPGWLEMTISALMTLPGTVAITTGHKTTAPPICPTPYII